jgi:hypothetical protein
LNKKHHAGGFMIDEKFKFEHILKDFVASLQSLLSDDSGQWTIKGFIDAYKNVYTISSDTKIISKILEIHIFPKLLAMADEYGYKLVLADHQNYYPDVSFVNAADDAIRFAVDFKTTYRIPLKPELCNGFTLGSHGKYFQDRTSNKNIQFPYSTYSGHYCIGIIYDRTGKYDIDETRIYDVNNLCAITSVIKNFQFFVAEKWRIASDKSGSGNTANIGSIKNIEDILNGHGIFHELGEEWFDDYWMNYNKITISSKGKGIRKIANLIDFVKYRNGDISLIPSRYKSVFSKEGLCE